MTEEEKIPTMVILPEAQAQIESIPGLKEAMPGIAETLKNAMQGVADGRYKTFDDAMEAMTGQRPVEIEPPNPPKYGYYLSFGPDPKSADRLMAIITDGHPKFGHPTVEIMDVEFFNTEAEAKQWYEIRCHTLPFEEGELVDVDTGETVERGDE